MKKTMAFLCIILFCTVSFAQNTSQLTRIKSSYPIQLNTYGDSVWIITSDNLVERFAPDRTLLESHSLSEVMNTNYVNIRFFHIDAFGSLWIGTSDGLVIYDGTWHYLTKDNSDLDDDYIRSIDSKGDSVWVGTESAGALLFVDKVIVRKINDEIPIRDKEIRAIHVAQNGSVWLGTYDYQSGGIMRYDGDSLYFYGIERGVPNGEIMFILESSNGTLWFGTEEDGLIKYDQELDSMFHYSVNKGLPESPYTANNVKDMFVDKYDTLWVATYNGIAKYVESEDTLLYYAQEHGLEYSAINSLGASGDEIVVGINNGYAVFNRSTFSTYYRTLSPVTSTHSVRVLQAQDSLLIGSSNGCISYNNGNTSLYTIGSFSNDVMASMVDSEGNLWIANYPSKLLKRDSLGKWECFPFLWGNETYYTYDIVQNPNGDIYFTGSKGIAIYSNNEWSYITQLNTPELPASSIYQLKFVDEDTYWMVTYDGLVYSNNGIITVFGEVDGLYTSEDRQITVGTNGELWVACLLYNYPERSIGISRFDGSQWTHFEPSDLFDLTTCNALATDALGNLWVGGGAYGTTKFIMFDGTEWHNYTEQIPVILLENQKYLSSFVFDSDGALWGNITQDSYAYPYDNYFFSYKENEFRIIRDDNYFGNFAVQHLNIDRDDNLYYATDEFGLIVVDQPLRAKAFADTACAGSPTTFTSEIADPVLSYLWEWLSEDTLRIGSEESVQYTFESPGDYTVKLTIADGVDTNWTYVNVHVRELPTIGFELEGGTPEMCSGSQHGISVIAEATSIGWSTGATNSLISVREGGVYTVTVTDEYGCINHNSVEIVELPLPVVEIASSDADNTICDGESVTLTVNDFESYEWQDGDINQVYTVSTSGEYSVEVEDSNGCRNTGSIHITVKLPFEEQLGLVTASERDDKMIIAWERTAGKGTESYNIYRQEASGFQLIGNQPFSASSYFYDNDANYKEQAFTYKITTVDECGNESSLENAVSHTSMHLIMVPYQSSFQLWWSKYLGIDNASYIVYESNKDGSDTVRIAELPSVNNSYTVLNYNQDKAYRVAINTGYEINPSILKSDTGPFSQSLSNIAESGIKTGVQLNGGFEAVVYPVPATTYCNVVIEEDIAASYEITLSSSEGAVVYRSEIMNSANVYESIPVMNLASGVYTLTILSGDNINSTQIVVE